MAGWTALVEDYLRRSMRSFANAERLSFEIRRAAEELLNEDIPPSVVRGVVS